MGGCNSTPAQGSGRSPGGGSDVLDPNGVRVRETGNNSSRGSRRPSIPATGMEAPELQHKLEKLDEERTKLQEELQRLQSAAALEQDADMTDGSNNGEKPRVRFSKFDGSGGFDATPPLPAPSSQDRKESVGRRTSSTSAIDRRRCCAEWGR